MEDLEKATWNKKRMSSTTLALIIGGSLVFILVIAGIIAYFTKGTTTDRVTSKNSTNSNTQLPGNTNLPPYNDNYGQINIRARDTERKTDLNMLANQLEAYYAKTGSYPTLININDKAWRTANTFNIGENDKALADPLSQQDTVIDGSLTRTRTGRYVYQPAPLGCTSLTDSKGADVTASNPCSGFTLTARLENTDDKQKDPSSPSGQTLYVKRNA